MPRQTRRLPVELTRFSYWAEGYARPMTARQLSRLPARYDSGRLFLRDRFQQHVEGGRCAGSGCSVDAELSSVSLEKREAIALEDYIENSREWERDAGAQRVFKRLPKHTRGRLLEIATRRYSRTGRRRWETLLERIAGDQKLFARMLPAGPTQVTKTTDTQYGFHQKIWTAYARQAIHVLEYDATLLGVSPIFSPTAPGRQRSRLDLTSITSVHQSGMVHWFAHALRNLVRYRDGHPPLPFAPTCAEACRRVATRLET